MVRDLMAAGYRIVMEEMTVRVRNDAEVRTEERLLDLLLPGIGTSAASSANTTSTQKEETKTPSSPAAEAQASDWFAASPLVHSSGATTSSHAGAAEASSSPTREKFRTLLRQGALDDRIVELQVSAQVAPTMELFAGQQMEELESAFSGIANLFGGKKKKKAMAIKDARRVILEEESERLVDKDKAGAEARERVEQSGIIFIDEIDKIATREGKAGGMDVSREGVQRDILPIVEGCKVSTKYGVVDTTHVLFIAAGAFNVSKPSDLIPELQGRFPIRVELEALLAADFKRILTEPENALVTQYIQLLGTEGVCLSFTDPAVDALARIAERANARTENIGARRLHTIMERLLEELSFDAPGMAGQQIEIGPDFVEDRFKGVFETEDLAKFIL